MEHEVLSISASFPEQRPNASLEVLSEYRFPSEMLESQSVWSSFPQNRPNVALECQLIQTSLPDNRSRTVRLQSPAVEVDRQPAVESVAMSKDV